MPRSSDPSPGCCECLPTCRLIDIVTYVSPSDISENDVTDVIENSFSVEDDRFGEVVTVDLKPGGQDIEVNEENKKEYVDLITEWRIQRRVEDQFKSFMSGFNELIPQELINVFDERELEVRTGSLALCPSTGS